MKIIKSLIILLIVCFSVSLSAQKIGPKDKILIDVAKEYLAKHPEDQKAKTFVAEKKVTKEFVNYFKSVSPQFMSKVRSKSKALARKRK